MNHGCHNTERQLGYWVKNGIRIEHGQGVYQMKFHPDTLSKECGYDSKKSDQRCEGCKK